MQMIQKRGEAAVFGLTAQKGEESEISQSVVRNRPRKNAKPSSTEFNGGIRSCEFRSGKRSRTRRSRILQ